MEFFAVLLSGLIALLSPINWGGEAIVTQQLKQQFVRVEDLQVRIDNTPSYQILQGKIDQVRIAGKGLFPIKDVRIANLQIETDPIALQGLRAKLAKPLQAGVKLEITERDINQALQSPAIVAQLKRLGGRTLGSQAANQIARYTFLNPRVSFIGPQRLRATVDLKEKGYEKPLKLLVETDVILQNTSTGQTLQLVNPRATADGVALYPPLTRRLIAGINQRLNLDQLEARGITARFFKLNFAQNQANVAMFIQIRPEALQKFRQIGQQAK